MIKQIHIKKKVSIIEAPPSKSFAQRALFAAALNQNDTTIENIGTSDDVLSVKRIIEQLGFSIKNTGRITHIERTSIPKNNTLNIGESGLGTRLSSIILSLFFKNYIIKGHGSILKRPMNWFKDYLPQFGLHIDLNNGFLPLKASGQIRSGNYSVDGSESSQYISGLLMTLPLCNRDSTLEVNNPTSTPYIDITLSVLKDFGVKIDHHHYSKYLIKGNQSYNIKSLYKVEGDFSSAAFWIAYGLLNGGIHVSNLNPKSIQADSAILEVVSMVGGNYEWQNSTLEIFPPECLVPFEFDASNCPDLFPILVVLAAGINGKSTIHGANRLIYKESNRKQVLLEEFSKLGLEMKNINNSIIIQGVGSLNSGEVASHNDHRIAMAATIASCLTPSGLSISNPNCVNKSYPEFWKVVENL